MATDKQKLARDRNWFKFRLMGNTSCVEQHYPSFTFSEKEKEIMQKIERLREQLIMEFEKSVINSKFSKPIWYCTNNVNKKL